MYASSRAAKARDETTGSEEALPLFFLFPRENFIMTPDARSAKVGPFRFAAILRASSLPGSRHIFWITTMTSMTATATMRK